MRVYRRGHIAQYIAQGRSGWPPGHPGLLARRSRTDVLGRVRSKHALASAPVPGPAHGSRNALRVSGAPRAGPGINGPWAVPELPLPACYPIYLLFRAEHPERASREARSFSTVLTVLGSPRSFTQALLGS